VRSAGAGAAISPRLPRLPYSGRRHADPVEGAPALSVSGLSVRYPGAPEPALTDASCSIPVGVRAALVGANGSGKSTLLKAAAGLLEPAAGSIRVHGLPVGACHHRVAYLPQRGEIDWRFPISVRRLVLGGRHVHLGWLRRPGAGDRKITDQVMSRLGILDLAERQIGELSGGQQQRALLARALAQESDLLLLDEPFTAVDASTQEVVFDVLEELQRENKALVVATHDLERLAEEFDGVLYLKEGRLTEPEPGAFVGTDYRETPWSG